jgi:hypothetical protein
MIDYNSIVRLTLKLFGVGLIVYGALTASVYLVPLITNQRLPHLGAYLPFVLPLAVPFVFGVVLWLYPAAVANTVIDVKTKSPDNEWAIHIERIGVSLLGLYLLFFAISDLTYQLTVLLAKQDAVGRSVPGNVTALIVANTVEFVVAALLLFRARGIAALLRKLRGSENGKETA